MYKFDWKIFVTPDLIAQIGSAAAYTGAHNLLVDCVSPLLSELFQKMGGKPVAKREYDLAERTAVAQKLLHEAILHALTAVRTRAIPGYILQENQNGQPPLVKSFDRIDLNSATAQQIDTLPNIGPGLAQRIVTERRRRPFASPTDLAQRTAGIGPQTAERIRSAVTFLAPRARLNLTLTNNLDQDLRMLLDIQAQSLPLDRVSAALDLLLISAAASRYPLAPLLLDDPLPAEPAALQAADITVLLGSRYYSRLQSLFAGAQQAIEVCLFHIALPHPTHPVRRLLQGLIDAHQRGVSVRVLVDQDRENDPYLSTVINANAIQFLRAGGVAVRTDAPEQLLHSKFVLIDSHQTLIGSHNWSAGSFFVFDDLTLLMHSPEVTAAQRQRFDALWAAGV